MEYLDGPATTHCIPNDSRCLPQRRPRWGDSAQTWTQDVSLVVMLTLCYTLRSTNLVFEPLPISVGSHRSLHTPIQDLSTSATVCSGVHAVLPVPEGIVHVCKSSRNEGGRF